MFNTNIDFEIIDVSQIKDEFPEKRDCFFDVVNYIKSENKKICAVFGLRRTGKTVLLQQALLSLNEEDKNKSVFITCNRNTDFHNVLSFIKECINNGKKYFFIDEVTYATDFQNLSSVLSDNFISIYNVKIIVTGTDSLGLSLPSHSILYDRINLIHTTYMSFAEFYRITKNKSIDFYLKHGSTLSEISPFDKYQTTNEYIETSIISNMISSLEKSEEIRTYPPALTELYEHKEIENAIQRIINQYSQTITLSALRRQFKLSPLNTAINNITKNSVNPNLLIKSQLEIEKITENAKKLLKIDDFKTKIKEEHLEDIKNFLIEMDVITCMPVLSSYKENRRNIDLELISHPRMYHANLSYSLDLLKDDDNWLSSCPKTQKNELIQNVYDCTAGKIQENFIIADIYKMLVKGKNTDFSFNEDDKKNRWYVSKFAEKINDIDEEVDLLILDKKLNDVYLFEIKHNKNYYEDFFKHLESSDLIKYIENDFGKIKYKAVLYNGKTNFSKKVPVINIADFLIEMYKNYKSVDYTVSKSILQLKKDYHKKLNIDYDRS